MKIRSIFPGRTRACLSSWRWVSSPQSNRKLPLPFLYAMAGDDLRRAAWPLSMLDMPP